MTESLERKESLNAGHTNDVFLTTEGTVVKRYDTLSASVVFHSLREFLMGNGFLWAEERIAREKEVRQRLGNDLRYPKIVQEFDQCLEFEFLEGTDLNEYLKRNPSKAREMGEKVGELMSMFQDKNLYLTDWMLDDIVIQEDGLAMLDFELGGTSQKSFRYKADRISIINQVAALETRTYNEFMQGLESKISLKTKTKAAGLAISFCFNLFYVWKNGKPGKVIKNASGFNRGEG